MTNPLITGSTNSRGERLLPVETTPGTTKKPVRRWMNDGTDASVGPLESETSHVPIPDGYVMCDGCKGRGEHDVIENYETMDVDQDPCDLCESTGIRKDDSAPAKHAWDRYDETNIEWFDNEPTIKGEDGKTNLGDPTGAPRHSEPRPAPKYLGVRARVRTRNGVTAPVAVVVGLTPEALDTIDGIAYKPHTEVIWPGDGSLYVNSYRVTGAIDAVVDYAVPRGVSVELVPPTPEQSYALGELERNTTMRADLDAKRIPPRRVIGTGYKNGRKEAERYLDAQIAASIAVIES